jgi:hypothetical protein
MKAFFVVLTVVSAATNAAYAQQQQQPRFMTCSQVAEYVKQQCASTYRPVLCQNTVEQNRTNCMATGIWEKTTFAGGSAWEPIPNLRQE